MAQRAYKSPVFAVFPFEQPGVFLYPRPAYDACDPDFLDAIHLLREEQAKGISVKKRPKRAAKKAPKKAARKDK